MSAIDVVGDVLVAGLLIAGVALELLCCLGVAVMRGAYARLHYTGPTGLGAVAIAAAIVVREGFSLIGNKALVIAAFLVVSSPVLAHITGRAARIRELGQLDVPPAQEAQDG